MSERRRYRWRLACDACKPAGSIYERWWSRKGQADRASQAEFCWVGGLIPERCSFGYRRLVLEGVIEAGSAGAAHCQAVDVARWTLVSMYGLEEYRDVRSDPPGLDVRVREVVDADSCNGCANDRSPSGVSAGQSGADDGNRTR